MRRRHSSRRLLRAAAPQTVPIVEPDADQPGEQSLARLNRKLILARYLAWREARR